MHKIKGLGWLPDLPDHRDQYFSYRHFGVLPPSVDLRMHCPPVYDQGQLGSCTANAIAGAIEFDRIKQKRPDWTPSRLFIYYNERVIEGTVDQDAGAMIRDGIKSVASTGDVPESEWPYDINKFADEPSPKCYSDAHKYRAVQYQRINDGDLDGMQTCLAAGYPFVIGFSVYESFERDQVTATGVVPMPGPDEAQIGGHAVLTVGYDMQARRFLVRNSWSAQWGMAGYFTIPFDYWTNTDLASDLWTIRVVL